MKRLPHTMPYRALMAQWQSHFLILPLDLVYKMSCACLQASSLSLSLWYLSTYDFWSAVGRGEWGGGGKSTFCTFPLSPLPPLSPFLRWDLTWNFCIMAVHTQCAVYSVHCTLASQPNEQSWALSVFLNIFNSKKWLVCIFYNVNNLFLHQFYLKSPLPVKLSR